VSAYQIIHWWARQESHNVEIYRLIRIILIIVPIHTNENTNKVEERYINLQCQSADFGATGVRWRAMAAQWLTPTTIEAAQAFYKDIGSMTSRVIPE
jgi:hypothetical protein